MLKLLWVAILCLSTAGCIQPSKPQYKDTKKLRAYISTGLALSVMTKPFVPDDEDEAEICDGSILLVNKQKLSSILYRGVGYKPSSVMIESLGEKIPLSVLEKGKDE